MSNRKKKTASRRNPVVVAAILRYGKTTTHMKDRRTPRGGSKKKDYLAEYG